MTKDFQHFLKMQTLNQKQQAFIRRCRMVFVNDWLVFERGTA